MDYSGQAEALLARVDAIDQEIPDRIRAQVRPLQIQLRRNRQEFMAFRDKVLGDIEANRQQNQSQHDRHERLIAEHNQLLRAMLNILLQQQAPRAQPPRRARMTNRRGPIANQARASGSQDRENDIREFRILAQARYEQDGGVYYRCRVCAKMYQRSAWFMRHLNGHQA